MPFVVVLLPEFPMPDRWFYNSAGRTVGPLSLADLAALARAGSLPTDALVKEPGGIEWVPASRVEAIFRAQLFAGPDPKVAAELTSGTRPKTSSACAKATPVRQASATSRRLHPVIWMAIGGGVVALMMVGVWEIRRLIQRDNSSPPVVAEHSAGGAPSPQSDTKVVGHLATPKIEPDVETFLYAKGLRQLDSFFVLADEVGSSSEIEELERLKGRVDAAERETAAAEKEASDRKAALVAVWTRRRALEDQLTRNLSAEAYNQIVSEHNRVADQEKQLEESVAENSRLKSAQAAAGNARESFIGELLKLRGRADRLQTEYGKLAADPELAKMIAAYNKRYDKHLALGPSPALASSVQALEQFEKTTLTDSIDVFHRHGQTWEVPVVINDRDPLMMTVDTGASLVSLPYDTAVALGVKPPVTAPTIRLSIADGRVIEAKKVTAHSVRVGKFEVQDVDVVVMPKSFTDAPLLLGQSFFRHFVYKIDPETAKLTMTKIGSTPEAAAASKIESQPVPPKIRPGS